MGVTTFTPFLSDFLEDSAPIVVGGNDCDIDVSLKSGSPIKRQDSLPAATHATTAITSTPDISGEWRAFGMILGGIMVFQELAVWC